MSVVRRLPLFVQVAASRILGLSYKTLIDLQRLSHSLRFALRSGQWDEAAVVS
jgi:hypothetical protein